MLLHDQGELAAAKQLYERALEIRERVLGPNHRRTLTTRRSLDELLGDRTETTLPDGD